MFLTKRLSCRLPSNHFFTKASSGHWESLYRNSAYNTALFDLDSSKWSINSKILTGNRGTHSHTSSIARNEILKDPMIYSESLASMEKLYHDKLPKYKAAIFDKDGTLVCFHAMWTPWAKSLNHRLCQATGLDLSSQIYKLLGVCSQTFKTGPGLLAEGTKEQIKQGLVHLMLSKGLYNEQEARRIVESNFEDGGVSLEHIRQLYDLSRLFSTLRQHGVKVAVCTSDTRASTVSALRQLGILHLVDKIVCADDQNVIAKPSPLSAFDICRELRVSPSDVVMVGDTATDMLYGQNAALGGRIGVLSGVGQESELLAHGAQEVIASVADILPLLLPDRVIELNLFAAKKIQERDWKLIIVDKDGTLTDIHFRWGKWAIAVGQQLQQTMDAMGCDGKRAASQFYTLIGLSENNTCIQGGLLAHGTVLHIKESLYQLLLLLSVPPDEVDAVLNKVWINPNDFPERVLEDAKTALHQLKQNRYHLAINTCDSRESMEQFLKSQGLAELIDCSITSTESFKVPKPLPHSNLMICKQLKISPSDTILFGDTCADMVSARAAQLGACIAVLSGASTPEFVLPHADVLIPNLSYAPQLLLEKKKNSNPTSSSSTLQGGNKLQSSQEDSPNPFKTAPYTTFRKTFPPHGGFSSQIRPFSTHATGRLEFSQVADRPTIAEKPEEFDYVIVGAGSAGCVLANRLSAPISKQPRVESATVCLLEAGPEDKAWTIHMPAALMYNLCHNKYNWYYHTIPETHMNNRTMYWPRGRVWGGSSSLNAMVYVRGHPEDYNLWEKLGARGWSYFDCLPYFQRAQCHELGANDYRGGEGPLHVSRGKTNHPLHQAWLEAGQQAGYPLSDDMNGFQQEGVAPMDLTIHHGIRWSAATAYLRPVLYRNNLTVYSQKLVHRILFDNKRAIGVEFSSRDSHGNEGSSKHTKKIMARKEVILSGGSLNSPQVLMLSGIGDATHLREVGINNIIQHLPGVGKGLEDHLEVYVQQKCKQPITLYSAQWKYPHNMVRIGAEYFAMQTGWGATSHLESGGFVRTSASVPHPNIQYHFLPSTVVDHGRQMGDCHAFQVHAGPLRSESRGRVWLHSNNPTEPPNMVANYMSTENDLREMRDGIRLAREIFAQSAFDPYRDKELLPGSDCQTDAQLNAFIRAKGDSAYHPSCTCRMGSPDDPSVVVDPNCRVLGVEGLRLVDASIMPSIVSGNLNAPTIMMAEKASDIILGKPPLPKKCVPIWAPLHPYRQRDGNPIRQTWTEPSESSMSLNERMVC